MLKSIARLSTMEFGGDGVVKNCRMLERMKKTTARVPSAEKDIKGRREMPNHLSGKGHSHCQRAERGVDKAGGRNLIRYWLRGPQILCCQ